jgi:hypothetical protein
MTKSARRARDDFSKQTVTELAKGAGYRCSNPDCRRPTDGSNAAQDASITIGVGEGARGSTLRDLRNKALLTLGYVRLPTLIWAATTASAKWFGCCCSTRHR